MEDEHKLLYKGSDTIRDSAQKAIGTISGKKVGLFDAVYLMGPYQDEVMIKKKAGLTREHYDMISSWTHPNAIPVLAYYSEGTNMGRYVIPKIHDSFPPWFELRGKSVFFDQEGKMTSIFRTFIVDICDVVESLQEKNIFLDGIAAEDLYIKFSSDGTPKFLLLITKVKRSANPKLDVLVTLQSIRDLIYNCCRGCDIELDSCRSSFVDFLASQSFTVNKLRLYPDTWDWTTKGEYLMALKCSDHRHLKSLVLISKIKWPNPVPRALEIILENSEAQNFIYDKNVPLDYLRVLWDAYKHFGKLYLHVDFGDHEGLINEIEVWTPRLWTEVYDIIGWP